MEECTEGRSEGNVYRRKGYKRKEEVEKEIQRQMFTKKLA